MTIMRSSLAIALLVVTACGGKPDDTKATGSGSAPAKPVEPKKPIDHTPLPPLSADSATSGGTGKTKWAVGFGGLQSDTPRGMAIAPSGDTYVVGAFEGEATFGAAGKFTAPDKKSDAYLVKIDPTGKIVWAKTWGGKRDDVATEVAVHGDTVVVVGQFLDDIKIGEFVKKSAGSDDMFVAAFDTKGEPQWLWTGGGVDSDGLNTIASAPDGGWVVGGSFSQSFDLDATHLKSKGHTDAVLIKLKAGGDMEWVKTFGGRYDDTILHVAIDGHANIIVQGHMKDLSDWGGKQLKAGGGSDNDILLAKYDANGDHVWSQNFGNAFNDVAGGVAVDPSGAIVMTGSFDKTVSFGAGDTPHPSAGESDIYVARYSPEGKFLWVKTYGGDREDQGFGIAVDKAGAVVSTGLFQGEVDFGKGPVKSNTPNKDVFVIKHDVNGNLVWVKTFGDHDSDIGRAAAMDADGNPTIAGTYRFKLDVVDPPLESVRDELDRIPKVDTFVMHMDK